MSGGISPCWLRSSPRRDRGSAPEATLAFVIHGSDGGHTPGRRRRRSLTRPSTDRATPHREGSVMPPDEITAAHPPSPPPTRYAPWPDAVLAPLALLRSTLWLS